MRKREILDVHGHIISNHALAPALAPAHGTYGTVIVARTEGFPAGSYYRLMNRYTLIIYYSIWHLHVRDDWLSGFNTYYIVSAICCPVVRIGGIAHLPAGSSDIPTCIRTCILHHSYVY